MYEKHTEKAKSAATTTENRRVRERRERGTSDIWKILYKHINESRISKLSGRVCSDLRPPRHFLFIGISACVPVSSSGYCSFFNSSAELDLTHPKKHSGMSSYSLMSSFSALAEGYYTFWKGEICGFIFVILIKL